MAQKVVNIAKNTSYYTLALILQKVVSFSYFVIIARALGPEDLGKYYFALSFTTIFAVFIDLGFSNVSTRETAKDPERAGQYLNNILGLKLPLTLVVWLALVASVNLMGYPQLTKMLVYLASACMILDSFTLTFFSLSRGFHNLIFESVASVSYQIIVLVAGLATLKLGYGVEWQMGALVAASLLNTIYAYLVVVRKWKVKVRPTIDRELAKKMILISLPFATFGIAQRFYTYFDTVLLSRLAGDEAVGIYQVAFKIIFALQFLPAAFSASLYPAFASYWQNNRSQLAITFERAMNYLLIIAMPISIGIISIADKILLLFTNSYANALWPLRLNIAALVFSFLNFALGALLNACDQQRANTRNMIIITLTSAAINLALIPKYQAVGASVAVLVSNIMMFILGMRLIPAITNYDRRKVAIMAGKVLLASAVMGALSTLLKNYLNVFLVVAISGLAYFGLLFAVRAFRKEDILSIVSSFKRGGGGEQTS
ncbi:flippase [Candidatus Falkowbacteria bacterium]|nr:flippase [Candidatus Falkowbacteria bacterium]